MTSRIAFALTSLAFGLGLGLAACAVEAGDPEAITEEPSQLTSEPAAGRALDGAGGPSTQTEYTYFRCSLNGGLWLTRTDCQAACAGGTCRLVLICKNDQGQQIPCP